jgi:hypothetical protein
VLDPIGQLKDELAVRNPFGNMDDISQQRRHNRT